MPIQFKLSIVTLGVLAALGSGQAMAGAQANATTGNIVLNVGGTQVDSPASINLSGGVTTITATNFNGTLNGNAASANYATSAGSAATAGTVTGAAQTAITSVGTLTSLGVSGAITTGSINDGVATLTGGNLSGVGTLTATTGNITTVNSTTGNITNIVSSTISNTGALNQTGVSTLVGTTNINTTGAAATHIGNATGATNINVGIAGTTNIGTTSGASLTNIGNVASINTIAGVTHINDNINAATTLNTGTSTGAVSIGNALNISNLNSATNNIGVNAYATTNNIGNGAATSINSIGNNAGFASTNVIGSTNTGTTVIERGGNTTLSLINNTASLTAGPTLATNGITGTTSGTGSGGLTVYNTAQVIGPNTTIPTALSPAGILNGFTYQNKINGNLLVDGNAYINGTLNYVSSNAANTTVIGAPIAGVGTSNLAAGAGTSGGTAIVMKGTTGATQTVSNGNGQLSTVVGTAAQSSASLTLTNGVGNTHGILVTETQTVISGGTHSTSLTFDNNDVTFRNAQTGAPIQVHGVADGTSDFDAVNVRQFAGAISAVTAMSNIPSLGEGKHFTMGVGVGSFMGKQALSVGGSLRYNENVVVKSSLAIATGTGSKPTFGIGAAMSW
ncbi:MAG TPA: hypothetical protein DE312_03020 [Gallionella sp.]|nr:MAG: hypothetical protein A2Z87_04685 [Gallionellales bacterium GWA2_54_124]HCI52297.1 hypothetical protein [Gallionella sp.]